MQERMRRAGLFMSGAGVVLALHVIPAPKRTDPLPSPQRLRRVHIANV